VPAGLCKVFRRAFRAGPGPGASADREHAREPLVDRRFVAPVVEEDPSIAQAPADRAGLRPVIADAVQVDELEPAVGGPQQIRRLRVAMADPVPEHRLEKSCERALDRLAFLAPGAPVRFVDVDSRAEVRDQPGAPAQWPE